MKALIIILAFIIILMMIGFGLLPFILASVLELSWINWFGVFTVPSGLAGVVAIIIQAKLFLKATD